MCQNSQKFSSIWQIINNRIKVVVSKDETFEEKNHNFIAPSKFKNFKEYLTDQISSDSKDINTSENSNLEKINLSPQNTETVDYPDSSDFSDDE